MSVLWTDRIAHTSNVQSRRRWRTAFAAISAVQWLRRRTEAFVMMRDHSYFVMEGCGAANVDVLRIGGGASCRTRVRYRTAPVSAPGHNAVSGADFEEVSGTLDFAPGELMQTISVPIVDDDKWEPLKRFSVILEPPEYGAVLGRTRESVVHILDDDAYPSCRGAVPTASPLILVLSFIQERWRSRVPKAVKSFFCLVYQSTHGTLATLFPLLIMQTHLKVEQGVEPEGELEVRWQLTVYALVYACSAALCWYARYRFIDLRGGSSTRRDLRNWIVARFVWLGEEKQLQLCLMSLFRVVTQDVEEAASLCWNGHWKVIAGLLDLLATLALLTYMGWLAVVPLILLLPAAALAVGCFWRRFQGKVVAREQAEDRYMVHAWSLFASWSLLHDHDIRDEASVGFERLNHSFYKAHRAARFLELHLLQLPAFLNELAISGILVVGGTLCARGDLNPADFFALVRLFDKVGSICMDVIEGAVSMARGATALSRVTEALNTELGMEASLAEQQQQQQDRKRTSASRLDLDGSRQCARAEALVGFWGRPGGSREALGSASSANPLRALSEIVIEDVSYAYPAHPGSDLESRAALRCVCARIPLGGITFLRSKPGEGAAHSTSMASTLLKLTTGKLLPDCGHVRAPRHLHMRLVLLEPLVFGDTVWSNLLPADVGPYQGEPALVWSLCRKLGVSEHILGHKDYAFGASALRVKLVDRHLVCIARALLSDPDVLCLCKPGALLKPRHRRRLYRLLGAWLRLGLRGALAFFDAHPAALVADDGEEASLDLRESWARADDRPPAPLAQRIACGELRTVLCAIDADTALPTAGLLGVDVGVVDLGGVSVHGADWGVGRRHFIRTRVGKSSRHMQPYITARKRKGSAPAARTAPVLEEQAPPVERQRRRSASI